MNNVHILKTEKPSRIFYDISLDKLVLASTYGISKWFENKHIYITSDEEIRDVRSYEGKWQLENGYILNKFPNYLTDLSDCKLVIMTTDLDLIEDGVQSIDDEFLEWFVKNPSCKFVKTLWTIPAYKIEKEYRIEIPQGEVKSELASKLKTVLDNMAQEEFDKEWKKVVDLGMESPSISEKPKEETVEEAFNKTYFGEKISFNSDIGKSFELGAKWQAERMYSEEEMLEFGKICHNDANSVNRVKTFKELFEQFKKK